MQRSCIVLCSLNEHTGQQQRKTHLRTWRQEKLKGNLSSFTYFGGWMTVQSISHPCRDRRPLRRSVQSHQTPLAKTQILPSLVWCFNRLVTIWTNYSKHQSPTFTQTNCDFVSGAWQLWVDWCNRRKMVLRSSFLSKFNVYPDISHQCKSVRMLLDQWDLRPFSQSMKCNF